MPHVISIRSLCRVAVATVFCVLAFSGVAAAQSVTLAWNANGEVDLAGYRVEYGTVSGNPTTTVDVGNVTQRQFTGLQVGVTYYFRVRAYNTSTMRARRRRRSPTRRRAPSVPTLSSIAPTSGPSSGGTVITLTGTNFASGATVRVNGVAGDRRDVRLGDAGAGDDAGRQRRRAQPCRSPTRTASRRRSPTRSPTSAAPGLTSVSPTSGPTAGGTTITITGTGFVSGATVRVNGVVGDRRHVRLGDAAAGQHAGRQRPAPTRCR